MRPVFFKAFFISAAVCKGQVIEKRVQDFIQQEKLDSFLVYTHPCVGSTFLHSCRSYNIHYLIWVTGGQYFVKQFKFCQTSPNRRLDVINPLSIYVAEKQRIDTEVINPPAYFSYKKKNHRVDTIMLTSYRDHSCFHNFSFILHGITVKKEVDAYDLETDTFYSGGKNIFYNYNQQTQFNKLIASMSSLAAKFWQAEKTNNKHTIK